MQKVVHTLVFLLLFFVLQQANGQDFVVKTKGDTLRGKIKLLQHDLLKKLQIQGADKKKTTLTIMEVKSVMLNHERLDPVKYNNQYLFMKLMKQGYLSLYAFQVEKQHTYDGRYLVKMDGKSMEVPNLGFKKNMIAFLQECEFVADSIETGKLGKNDLTKIIDEFNACIDKRSILTYSPTAVKLDPSTASAWNDLQVKVEASSIEDKADALEMISEVKAKLSRGEKLPKFLLEGLAQIFEGNEELTEALNKAIATKP
jgi:hypothetical protein